MRIVLTSHGSTGDIYPVIALAVALRERGHSVRFATMPHYRAEIEAAGVAFYPLCPDWEQPDLSYWMGRLNRLRSPVRQLREIYVGARSHVPEMVARLGALMPETDLLVSSYLFPMNKAIADRHRVPFATLAFAPHVVPSPDYAPENIPSPRWLGRTLRRAWNRRLWRTAEAFVDRTINSALGDTLRQADLPPVEGFFSTAAERVLVTVPEKLFRVADAELDPRFRHTGYLRWQSPENPALEADLLAFTGGARVPVLTFGSMVYDDAGAWMQRLDRAWPAGEKIIVQRGWARFPRTAASDRILVVGQVSHDQLFRHASAVVHHGGAGTTASALHAGAPQVVVPHIGDQAFFAERMASLGVGVTLSRKHWPERLAPTLRRLLGNPETARRADEIARELRAENGPERAAIELETYVAERGARG